MSTREIVARWLATNTIIAEEHCPEAADELLALLTEQQEPVGWIEEDELPVAGRATIHSEPNASRVRVYLGPQQDRDREAMEKALQEIAVNYPPGSLAHLTAKRGLGILATPEADDAK